VSAAAFSLGHGGNDAQKTMGVILAVLIGAGYLPTGFGVPLWVVLCAHTRIGPRHAHRWLADRQDDGFEDHRLQPVGGVAAESAAGRDAVLHVARRHPRVARPTPSPAPSSGVGASRRLSAVRGACAGRVVWAWIVTIPGAWLIATAAYGLVALFN
jgi:PiT family inorganic phosphate transporter